MFKVGDRVKFQADKEIIYARLKRHIPANGAISKKEWAEICATQAQLLNESSDYFIISKIFPVSEDPPEEQLCRVVCCNGLTVEITELETLVKYDRNSQ